MFALDKSPQGTPASSTLPKLKISFQASENNHYIALLDNGKEEPEYKQLYDSGDIYTTLAPTTSPSNIFSIGNDPIKTFYIGSITVVGLYLVYRILDRTK
jgi:hypothetical protein